MSQNLNASCEKATPGWPCDKRIEELRDQFALESDAAKKKAIADEIQTRAVTLGTHYPLGEWYGQFAYRTSTKGWLPPMTAMLFWNAEKTHLPGVSKPTEGVPPAELARVRSRTTGFQSCATGQ